MVREWIVIYAVVHLAIWIASTLSTELPYCPIFTMF